MLNKILITKMLQELGMPEPDDIEEGRQLIALAFNEDPESLERFRQSLVSKIQVEFIALSDGSERLHSQVSFEDGS